MDFKDLYRRILSKVLCIKYESYYLFEIDVTNVTLPKPISEEFDIIKITSDNIVDYDFSLFTSKLERFVERLKNPTYEFYVIVESNKVCYYTWISKNEFIYPRYISQKRLLSDDEAFLFDSQCAEKYKGKGFHSYMNAFRLVKIKEMGKTKAQGLVLSGNIPALRTQNKSGMKIIKLMNTFCCKWLRVEKVKFVNYES